MFVLYFNNINYIMERRLIKIMSEAEEVEIKRWQAFVVNSAHGILVGHAKSRFSDRIE